MDVSDRRMQVQLTQEAKIVSDFYSIGAIFAFVGFVSALILAQGGKDMLPVCGIDAVCPCGAKALQSWRAGFWFVAGQRWMKKRFAHQERSGRRAGRTETCRPALHEAAAPTQPSRRENCGLCPHPLKGPDP